MGGLKIAARIDRIDELADLSHVIVDYKTGKSSVSAWMGARPDDPQLPLYAITDTGPLAAVSFAVLRADKVAFEGLARDADLLPGVARFDQAEAQGAPRELGRRVRRLAWNFEGLAQRVSRRRCAGHSEELSPDLRILQSGFAVPRPRVA